VIIFYVSINISMFIFKYLICCTITRRMTLAWPCLAPFTTSLTIFPDIKGVEKREKIKKIFLRFRVGFVNCLEATLCLQLSQGVHYHSEFHCCQGLGNARELQGESSGLLGIFWGPKKSANSPWKLLGPGLTFFFG
jgi:hypothetical protein